ncbi:hypothetical protein BN1723_009630 [Verticillium longisporum]|uniref:Uncharacterized protein n=1 Tax=Verticillium longisporum TaxID=100787 RepID=A0A0G4KR25_VERLO|nr:hypothetical protein BN1723_009630 [Verticillium longisporum]
MHVNSHRDTCHFEPEPNSNSNNNAQSPVSVKLLFAAHTVLFICVGPLLARRLGFRPRLGLGIILVIVNVAAQLPGLARRLHHLELPALVTRELLNLLPHVLHRLGVEFQLLQLLVREDPQLAALGLVLS